MALRLADRVFAALLLLTGIYVSVAAYRYGLYRSEVPGPGFFPFVAGLALAAISAAILIRTFRGSAIEGRIEPSLLLSILGLMAAIAAFNLLAPTLGITLSALVAMIWIGWASEEPAKKNRTFLMKLMATSAAVAAACHLLFATLIGVPLITGPFGF